MNKVEMIGRLTKDNEIKYYNDRKYLKNTIAVRRDFKNKEGKYDSDFFTFTTWGKQAEYVEKYSNKGTTVAICGKLLNNNYKKDDGTIVYSNDIQVENIMILGKFNSSNEGEKSTENGVEFDDENLPW